MDNNNNNTNTTNLSLDQLSNIRDSTWGNGTLDAIGRVERSIVDVRLDIAGLTHQIIVLRYLLLCAIFAVLVYGVFPAFGVPLRWPTKL